MNNNSNPREDLRLNEIEASVIMHRFGLGGIERKTLKEIGVIHNLSAERIRQIEMKALRKLRNQTKNKG